MENRLKRVGLLMIILLSTTFNSYGFDGLWSGRLKVTGLGLSSNVHLYLEEIPAGGGYKGILIYNLGKKSENITSVFGYSNSRGIRIMEVSQIRGVANTNLISISLRASKNPKTGVDVLRAERIYQVKSSLVFDTGSLEMSQSTDPLSASYRSLVNHNPPVTIRSPLVKNAAFATTKIAHNSYSILQFGLGTSQDLNRDLIEPLMEIIPDENSFKERSPDYTSYLKLPSPEQNEGARVLLRSVFLSSSTQAQVKVKLSLVNEYYKDTFRLAESILFLPVEDLFAENQSSAANYNDNPTMKAVGYEYGLGQMEPVVGRRTLEGLAQQGDAKAIGWLGYFKFFGKGGFNIDKGSGRELMFSVRDRLTRQAEGGDPESMFLIYQILSNTSPNPSERKISINYLQRASFMGYLPAQYESGLIALTSGSTEVARKLAEQSFAKGLPKSALILGLMHVEGRGGRKDVKQALAWYQRAADAGDATALGILSQLYSNGMDLPPDPTKAVAFAKQAANRGNSGAMVFLGDVFLNGNQGVKKDPKEALKWYTNAAEAGNSQGMLSLGLMFEKGNELGLVTDQKSAFYWINLAGINGNVSAMFALAGIYEEGVYTEMSQVKSRFWRAEAEALRPSEQRASPRAGEDIANFWKYADFSPTYYYLPDEDRVVSTGTDVMGGIFSGLFGSYLESRSQVQPQFNKVELIYEKDGERVYGGTISSGVREAIRIVGGKEVEAFARGRIKLGFLLDNVTANGISGYQNFSIDPKLPHGAFIMRIPGSPWVNFGTNNVHRFNQGGLIDIAINDADYSNNAGYFDVKIIVRD
ncbi:hypothetical protein ADIS_3467 [Lunatimonas lonarensis]|uniref:Sel1 repeat family protein n=1 Tax=Lunatimonas lonarensis TaxID=1232681 RepID=R7ZQQ2_9BACT|nr:tetratricopeptide repeat protein [Lunatimonas lonarensis]EON76339.1 hypothetical protein ADIS_3467 [Lunatimonas lonarensis]